MKRKYLPNDKGYVNILRGIQNLLNSKILNFSLLGVYICYAMEADWDKSHKYYRAITPDDSDLSRLWGCNKSTVFRKRKELVKKGLLEEVGGVTYVKNLALFKTEFVKVVTSKNITNLHNFYAKSESEFARMLFGIAEKQSEEPNNL